MQVFSIMRLSAFPVQVSADLHKHTQPLIYLVGALFILLIFPLFPLPSPTLSLSPTAACPPDHNCAATSVFHHQEQAFTDPASPFSQLYTHMHKINLPYTVLIVC